MVVETEPALHSDRMPLPNSGPTVILDWPPLPDGRTWGATAGIDVGPDGHLWVKDRCGSNGIAGGCDVTEVDPILKLDRETGEVLTSVGAGRFITPYALAFDSRGRLFVADRGNRRIQIFGQDGKRIDVYDLFSRIGGLFITPDGMPYAIDSTSNASSCSGWNTGIRIGHASEDCVTPFVSPHVNERGGGGAQGVAWEGVSVDGDGIVYGTEGPGSRPAAGSGITK